MLRIKLWIAKLAEFEFQSLNLSLMWFNTFMIKLKIYYIAAILFIGITVEHQ